MNEYRKIEKEKNEDIIEKIYKDIVRRGRVDEDYMREKVRREERKEGEIEKMQNRVEKISKWNLVQKRNGWIEDKKKWKEKKREIEERM